MRALLDTHVLVWWLEGSPRLSTGLREVLDAAGPGAPLLVSGITLWEVATLVALGRLRMRIPLRDWLERAVAPPLVELVGISPAIAAEVATLPDSFHRDPADRILIATARVLGATLATQDERIVASDLVATVS